MNIYLILNKEDDSFFGVFNCTDIKKDKAIMREKYPDQYFMQASEPNLIWLMNNQGNRAYKVATLPKNFSITDHKPLW